jgi:hypothetical protein
LKTRFFLHIGIVLAVGGLFPHAAYAQHCEPYWTAEYKCMEGCGPCPSSGGAAAAPAAPALNPALGNAAQSVGNALGQQLGKALFGDPAAKAANAAAAQKANVAAQQNALAAHQLNDSGIYLLTNGNYNGAINEFQQALAIAPNDANILYNLSVARQKLKDAALAAKASSALAPFLGNSPANPGNSNSDSPTHSSGAIPNASALSLVNLDSNVVDLRDVGLHVSLPATLPNSDSHVVNLSGTTSTSPASLKSQIDAVFGNPAPASTPPTAQVTPADVSAVFDEPVPDPNATMKAIFDLNANSK